MDWTLNQAALDKLLGTLATDREEAGRQYERIRGKLIQLFTWRHCEFPEELADEVLNRVARKVESGVVIHSADPYAYFHRVAALLIKESFRHQKRKQEALDPRRRPPPLPAEPEDPRLPCLQKCLAQLPEDSRTLVLRYHRGEKRQRIEQRKALAAELGVPLNALRIRAFRIRNRLEKCVSACVLRHEGETEPMFPTLLR